MPAFYSSGPTASHMPITPPDSGSGYGYSSMHYPSESYAQHQHAASNRHTTSYDYQPSYSQHSAAPGSTAYQYPANNYQPSNSLPPIQTYYEPIGAPILPPLRTHDRFSYTADDYQRRLQQQEAQNAAAAREQQQKQAAKEDKATGGVSAKLDYDMARMTDFVTDATMTIFHHAMHSPPSFRKWVHQVLSATRLPSSTIMLSLYYLNDRVAYFPETVSTSENQIYRLLAVALILGSKFLDDNTFINRSWSDVTAINVQELNKLETKWLELINWKLHVDLESCRAFQDWLRAWKDYHHAGEASKQPQPQSTRPLSLDTNVHHHSAHYDRYSPYPTPYTASTRSFDTLPSARNSQYASHTYASDAWTPAEPTAFDDFYKRQHRYPTLTEIDDVNRRASEERARHSYYGYSQASHPSYYQSSAYNSSWNQPAWNAAHRYDCQCQGCAYSGYYRPQVSTYSAQTVIG